jgi:hypothetical protein
MVKITSEGSLNQVGAVCGRVCGLLWLLLLRPPRGCNDFNYSFPVTPTLMTPERTPALVSQGRWWYAEQPHRIPLDGWEDTCLRRLNLFVVDYSRDGRVVTTLPIKFWSRRRGAGPPWARYVTACTPVLGGASLGG